MRVEKVGFGRGLGISLFIFIMGYSWVWFGTTIWVAYGRLWGTGWGELLEVSQNALGREPFGACLG
jgi:hypothetical protein